MLEEAEFHHPSDLPIISTEAGISAIEAETIFAYCNKLKLGTNTRYLAYMVFNKIIIASEHVERDIALAFSVFLASKMHENSPLTPNTILKIAPKIGNTNRILKYELYILNKIGFSTFLPTLHDWISMQVELFAYQLHKEVKNMLR